MTVIQPTYNNNPKRPDTFFNTKEKECLDPRLLRFFNICSGTYLLVNSTDFTEVSEFSVVHYFTQPPNFEQNKQWL